MITYKQYAPTTFDARGLALPERQGWYVLLGRNRDSDCLDESNFHCALKELGGEGPYVEVHRFGHWACGWLELILVCPETAESDRAKEIECAIACYPILDEHDFSEREQTAADLTWRNCFGVRGRIDYIRDHRSQFEFRSFADILGCVRGNYFAGYASELLRA